MEFLLWNLTVELYWSTEQKKGGNYKEPIVALAFWVVFKECRMTNVKLAREVSVS